MNNRIVFPVWCMIGLLIVTSVNADIVTTGPFAGEISEGFESFSPYQSGPLMGVDVLSIAVGAAEIRSAPASTNQLWVINPSQGKIWGLDDYGLAAAHSGQQALGMYNFVTPAVPAVVDIVFSGTVNRAGFHYLTNSGGLPGVSNMSVSFFDTADLQIGSDFLLDSGGSAYQWAGWQSDEGIKRIRFDGNFGPVIDSFQASAIPEPSAFAILGLGAIGFTAIRRRRNASS